MFMILVWLRHVDPRNNAQVAGYRSISYACPVIEVAIVGVAQVSMQLSWGFVNVWEVPACQALVAAHMRGLLYFTRIGVEANP
jgi:hypothetical protein